MKRKDTNLLFCYDTGNFTDEINESYIEIAKRIKSGELFKINDHLLKYASGHLIKIEDTSEFPIGTCDHFEYDCVIGRQNYSNQFLIVFFYKDVVFDNSEIPNYLNLVSCSEFPNN